MPLDPHSRHRLQPREPAGRGDPRARRGRRLPDLQVPLVLGLIWGVHLAVNLIWLGQDNMNALAVPDGWIHAQGATRVVTSIRLQDPLAALAFLFQLSSHYTMLAHLPLGLVGALLGSSDEALRGANALYLALLLLATYRLGHLAAGRRAGLLAAALVSLMPAVYGGSRTIGLDFPALCVTPMAVLYLLRSDGFSVRRPALLFGVWAGVAILVRGQTALFLVGPAVWVLVRALVTRRGPARRATAVHAALAVLVVLGVTAPWWAQHAGYLLHLLRIHASGQGMIRHEGDISLWGGVVHYTLALPQLLTGPLAVGLLVAVPRFRRVARHAVPVLLWIAVPLVLHVLLKVRNVRYLFPLVPAAAVVIAVSLSSLRPRLRGAVAGAAALGAVALWIICSFAGWRRAPGAMGPVERALSALRGPPRSLAGYLLCCGDGTYARVPYGPESVWDRHQDATAVLQRLTAEVDPRRPVLLRYRLDRTVPEFFQTVLMVQDGLPRALLGSPEDTHVHGAITPGYYQVFLLEETRVPRDGPAGELVVQVDRVRLWRVTARR